MKRHKVYLGATDPVGPPPSGSTTNPLPADAETESYSGPLQFLQNPNTKNILLGAAAIFGIYYLTKKK